jgi:hypothetical protein
MPERRPVRLLRKRGLVALLKTMKPSREAFPEIHDPVPAPQQLKKSLRSKRATGNWVGTITEDDKYGGP